MCESSGLGMNSQRNSGVNSVGTAVKAKCIKVQGEICKSLTRTSAPLRTSSINDGGHIKLQGADRAGQEIRHRISLYGRCLNDLMV